MIVEDKTPIQINLHILYKDGKPIIELRKKIQDPELIKKIISAGFYDQAIITIPHFNDKLNGIASLMRVGIIYKDEKGNYQYTI